MQCALQVARVTIEEGGRAQMMDIMWPISQSHFHVSCDAGPGAKPAQHCDTRDELGKC